VARYNTALGLVVALPAMIFFRHFRAKVDSFLVDMEQQASKLVDLIHGERIDFDAARPQQSPDRA
jgi:biopolymer transport protein ExbB